MSDLADQGSAATRSRVTTTTMSDTRRESVSTGATEGTADLIGVCRSATLRRAAYQFYRALLLTFPETGSPPDRSTLRTLARRYAVPLEATLADMARQDLVQRDPATGAIRAAYPFSGVPTAHRVTLPIDPADPADPTDRAGAAAIQLYAMCALDALGIPLMLRRAALVTSIDALAGQAVRMLMRRSSAAERAAAEEGDASTLDGWMAVWEPSTAVVFARPEEHECEGGVAAGSCFPLTNFFVAREQAERWAVAHGSSADVVLTPDEALRRAHTLFAGVLERLDGVNLVNPVDPGN